MKREKLLNIPNLLTGLRMALIIAFVAVHFALPDRRSLAVSLLALGGLTDFLDGRIARRFHQVTWLGKLLDPLADKLMIVAVLVCLVDVGALPLWLVLLAIAKEGYMVTGGVLLYRRGIVIPSDLMGKIPTFLFVPGAFFLYPWHDVLGLTRAGRVLMILSISLSLLSAVHYTLVAVKKSNAAKMD